MPKPIGKDGVPLYLYSSVRSADRGKECGVVTGLVDDAHVMVRWPSGSGDSVQMAAADLTTAPSVCPPVDWRDTGEQPRYRSPRMPFLLPPEPDRTVDP
jgi:hypothetical protein